MKTVLLIGLGRFGTNVAIKLNELGHEVMAVDCDEERVDDILPIVTAAQIGDSTNEGFLETLGIENYDACIVAIAHDFQSSLETTSLLKEMGARLVVARAESDIQKKFLLRNGADEVVYIDMSDAILADVNILQYESVIIVSAEATSEWVVDDDPTRGYFANDAIDGDITSDWEEGAEGIGEGEKISLYFEDSTPISIIKIFPGCLWSEEWFYKDNRPTAMRVGFANGSSYIIRLSPYTYEDAVRGFAFVLPETIISNSVTITLLDAGKGEACDDTAISEVEVYSLREEPLDSDPTGWKYRLQETVYESQ